MKHWMDYLIEDMERRQRHVRRRYVAVIATWLIAFGAWGAACYVWQFPSALAFFGGVIVGFIAAAVSDWVGP